MPLRYREERLYSSVLCFKALSHSVCAVTCLYVDQQDFIRTTLNSLYQSTYEAGKLKDSQGNPSQEKRWLMTYSAVKILAGATLQADENICAKRMANHGVFFTGPANKGIPSLESTLR